MPGKVKPGDEWIPLALLGRYGPGEDRGLGLGRTEGWAWLHTPIFSLLGRLKQGDLELKGSLGSMKPCFRRPMDKTNTTKRELWVLA